VEAEGEIKQNNQGHESKSGTTREAEGEKERGRKEANKTE
jgi:hypothetical protein